MPQLEPEFYTGQLFWLLVTFVALYLVIWKLALPRIGEILEARQSRIDHDLERATVVKEEAASVAAAYEAELAKARADAHAALGVAATEATADAAEEIANLAAKLSRDYAQAEARIDEARDQAVAGIARVAGELAGAAVERLTGVEAPAERVRAAVDTALAETD